MTTPYQIDYAKELNEAQLEAVFHNEGPMLVIAGAGSGKTRTLTFRVARMVEDGISPARILLLTFTRKAAQEMLFRASYALDHRCHAVAGGTFHAFANTALRRYGRAIDLAANFMIMDRDDSGRLVAAIAKDVKNAAKLPRFPQRNTLLNIFSRVVNQNTTVEDIIYDDYFQFSDLTHYITSVYAEYGQRKREHACLDYDDLLIYMKRLLEVSEETRDYLGELYQYIMVDEYQDTNQLQADILYLLTTRHQNIMAVGDDSQSIYAFRGANFKNIMNFPHNFQDTKIVSLEENYRSTQPILDVTNGIIAQTEEKYSKHLFTKQKGGGLPRLVGTETDNAQSRFIVQEIIKLYQSGTPLSEIAVLFKAGFHSFDLEVELARAEIPFIKVGGFKFTEAAHIKDMLAYLRVFVNPLDRVSWVRILMLVDKIGERTAEQIYENIRSKKMGYAAIFPENIDKQRATLKPLQDLFRKLDALPMPLLEMGNTILDYYRPILEKSFDDYPKRMKDLMHLLEIMSRYTGADAFLADITLDPPNTSLAEGFTEEAPKEHLVLSTIHSAKGLEWDHVYIIGAMDGYFPSLYAGDNTEAMDEELRLLYVAATRARKQLTFTHPARAFDRSSGMVLGLPSRFLTNLPVGLLEKNFFAQAYSGF